MADAAFPNDLLDRAATLLDRCRARRCRLATAESCTGGMIAGCLTEIAGSSDVVDCGFVTYSNDAKRALLGVGDVLLSAHGAVSEPVARAMAEGAVTRSGADLAVAVTGVAGPGGGSAEKPVGLVHFAVAARDGETIARKRLFDGDRQSIRLATVREALSMLAETVESAT